MDIQRYMAAVPDMDRFYTVDELQAHQAALAAEFPAIARRRRVGTSRLGEPINLLSIGTGGHNAFLFGCPHPNEPIGSNLAQYLARLLCEDQPLRDAFDYTWHIVPCVDPDGTRLNEAWFAGPYTPRNYARHFFRPAAHQQVEWTFPISYKELYFDRALPETQMLMRLIDEVKPELMVSLHNAGFGGVYYYLSREAEPVYATLHQIPAWEDLPLQLGEPEVPFATTFAPAIFSTIGTSEQYDYLEQNGADPLAIEAGESSDAYARSHNTFSLVTEVAYYDDPRVMDQTKTDTLRRDAILEGLDLREEGRNALATHFNAVAAELRGHSPFETSVRWWIAAIGASAEAERNWARTDPDTDRPATVAEVFSNRVQTQFYRLLSIGMLLRMLEGEVGIGNGTPAIRQHLADVESIFEAWADKLEAALAYRVVPIRKLVAVQLGAILAVGQHLHNQRAGTD